MSDETVKGEWKGFSKSLFANISANDVTGLAAQIAYYFLLSLFPLLIFIVTLLTISCQLIRGIYSDWSGILPRVKRCR